ncbi:Bacterial antitoxin of type II TA system, VapB [Calidithermus terrae]|uniref:Bacterial antitoxin of type II TA system, VapB n=1 Tax=Calidithermus terrae TaxID=1408545 RepID=A0A399F2L8_9DEIN|nr:Bacterial antitoxin of type II TA system, VapB [Calidithermus terrae]
MARWHFHSLEAHLNTRGQVCARSTVPRITVETDEALLEEARRVLGVHTKREAIERALQKLVRQQRRRAIRVHAG